MKTPRLVALCLTLTALLWPALAQADWLIDQGRFHASAHGRLSCLDCHQRAAEAANHPDPVLLNMRRDQLFDAKICGQCHDSAEALAAKGSHGGQPVSDPEQLADCLACHQAHYQPPAGGRPKAFDPAKPLTAQCGACHQARQALPEPTADDARCASCHLQDPTRPALAAQRAREMCLYCHQHRQGQAIMATPMDPAALKASVHGGLGCQDCHAQAALFPHDGQEAVDCLACHQRHVESQIHDAHAAVDCQACHLAGGAPQRQAAGGRVVWRGVGQADGHTLRVQTDEESCRRCHQAGNQIGAAAAVLPAKGLLCLPCHAATLTVGDWPTAIGLALFLGGLALVASVWLAAPRRKAPLHPDSPGPAPWPQRLRVGFSALVLDGLAQRRLWRADKTRWAIHGLIFFPFALRCLWGLVALAASHWLPEWSAAWPMLDKNHPATALFFDLGGALILAGAATAMVRKFVGKDKPLPGLPRPDVPALILLGLAIASGFWLEGMRMALTGAHEPWAFIGAALAGLMDGWAGLDVAYGWFWYAHAALWCAFVAYLPFSRMLHMLLAPVALALGAAAHAGHDDHQS